MMQILERAGLPLLTDQLRPADLANERGYYEYEPVKFMKEGDVAWMELARGKVVKIISHLLAYLPAEYEYKLIFMQRNLAEVVASQNRMLENKGEAENKPINNEELVRIFSLHLRGARQWIADRTNIQAVFVDYNRLMQDPTATLKPVEDFLAMELAKPEILTVVDLSAYRHRASS